MCISDQRTKSTAEYYFPEGYVKKGKVYKVKGFISKGHKFGDWKLNFDGIFIEGLRGVHVRSQTDVPWPVDKFCLLSALEIPLTEEPPLDNPRKP